MTNIRDKTDIHLHFRVHSVKAYFLLINILINKHSKSQSMWESCKYIYLYNALTVKHNAIFYHKGIAEYFHAFIITLSCCF